jgi:glutamate racemase
MKLGVFDSGIGGLIVAQTLQKIFPTATILTANDTANVPYGGKSPSEIITLTDTALQPLLHARCDIIILACNTATAIAIAPLREKYPHQTFVGIEPMIKTAATLTKTNVIGVFATPATLESKHYMSLVDKHAHHLTLYEPDCSNWASMIENSTISDRHIRTTVESICLRGADVLVLGCTHYHWIQAMIRAIAGPQVTVLEPSKAIARRIQTIIDQQRL